ncbi:hypothetical protein NL676_030941 [Syzygium grande]|nr:hypothetical protein NL676_030941 [Syzygium grande]
MEAQSLALLAMLLFAAVADWAACATTFNGETPMHSRLSREPAMRVFRRDGFRARSIGPRIVPLLGPQANRAYRHDTLPSPPSRGIII